MVIGWIYFHVYLIVSKQQFHQLFHSARISIHFARLGLLCKPGNRENSTNLTYDIGKWSISALNILSDCWTRTSVHLLYSVIVGPVRQCTYYTQWLLDPYVSALVRFFIVLHRVGQRITSVSLKIECTDTTTYVCYCPSLVSWAAFATEGKSIRWDLQQ